MTKGKIAAQASHASLSSYLKVLDKNPSIANDWLYSGQKKVVLKISGLEAIASLFERVKKEIPCALITDAGHTQVDPGSVTALGIGPWDEATIDKYVKDLKLL